MPGLDGDVRGGGLHEKGQGHHRGAVWHVLLKEHGLKPRGGSGDRAFRVAEPAAGSSGLSVLVRRCQGTYEKVRVNKRVVSQGVLIASAVRDDGLREIVGVEVTDTESEATYQELFRSLKGRGLSGVELVISDDHEGLKAAIGTSREPLTRGVRSTTRGTCSAWSHWPVARNSPRISGSSSPLQRGSRPWTSLPR